MTTDYVAVSREYAKEASLERNKSRFGRWVRLAARRYLDDLKRATRKDCAFYFDPDEANRACAFLELLPHVEGKWQTPTITLHRSDVFFVVNLFGFRKREDGTRRFSSALKAVARKNAKSTVAAGILLYCQVGEGEEGPQVISAATTGDQARIIFKIAKRMVEKTEAMREAFQMEPFAHAIASYCNGGTFKPINAKASTQDGLNPSAVGLDEIHAHKDGDLLNVLRSAAGARKNPLFLFTTTEGYESPGPWAELRQFAKQVLEGIVEADHFLAVYYAVDDEDDDFDESAWIKANPLMEVNPILLTEIRKEAIEAKSMPSKLAEFRIKRLNRQSSTARGFVRFDKWKACAKLVDLDLLRTVPCYGGLDLASNSDLCAFRLVWELDGVFYTKGWRWVPEEAVKGRTVRGTVPYAGWVAGGHLIQVPGEVVDYAHVEKVIRGQCAHFNVVKIGYDSWNSAQLVAKLADLPTPLEMFIQGPKSYHPAIKEFERAYLAGNFAFGESDPVLTWCAANLVMRYDVNLNMAPDRKKAADKIDDMAALLMAFGMATGAGEPPAEFQCFFVG